MAENMAASVGNDGSSLSCYANTKEDPDFVKKYGCLYIWEDAMKVCPKGWHLPQKVDFQSLLSAAGSNENKSLPNPAFLALAAKNPVWKNKYQAQVTNSTALGALPAGVYNYGSYHFWGINAFFWSATEDNSNNAYYLSLGNDIALVNYVSNDSSAFSVRRVKD